MIHSAASAAEAMVDVVAQFRAALSAENLHPAAIIADGAYHRFSTDGRPGDDAGWYVLSDDVGAFGCWRQGIKRRFEADAGRELTPDEIAARAAVHEAHRAAHLAAVRERQREIAERAEQVWNEAEPAPDDHPYLARKQVASHGLRASGDTLLVPVTIGGRLVNIQFIDSDGRKLFMPGGRAKGGCFIIGEPTDQLLLCEGFAPGASLHEATGIPTCIAFFASNLSPVATRLARNNPHLRITVCADDDLTDGNPGMTAARKVAASRLVVPDFGEDRPEGMTEPLHVFPGHSVLHEIPAHHAGERPFTLRPSRDTLGAHLYWEEQERLGSIPATASYQ